MLAVLVVATAATVAGGCSCCEEMLSDSTGLTLSCLVVLPDSGASIMLSIEKE